MFESETEGDVKGSLKDRLRFLNILIRIAKLKKYNITFLDVNGEKLDKCSRFFMFFYTPVKVVLSEDLKTNNTIIYNGLLEDGSVALTRNENMVVVDLEVIRRRKKKGIGLEEIKKEISEKLKLPKEEISNSLANDYSEIKNNSSTIFDTEVSEELKEEIIKDRVKAEKVVSTLHEFAENEKDIYLGKDIDYDVKVSGKSFEKVKKALEKSQRQIEKISRDIDEYTIKYERKLNVSNLDELVSGVIGIGVGLITLPFSFSRTFALGTNLIDRSMNKIGENLKFRIDVTREKNYKIDIKDIMSAEKALKSSDFLLEDVLFKLDNLKYKIKLMEYKIPDVDKKMQEIELIEKGLIKKKRELRKIVEAFDKTKVKVINRDNKNQ